MAITFVTTDLQFSSNPTTSLNDGATVNADVHVFNQTCVGASVWFEANNDGTPASGDTVEIRARYGTTSSDIASAGHYDTLRTLDTNTDDPASDLDTLKWPVGAVIIQFVSANGTHTIRGAIIEQRQSS
jgi:hypothetical protein